MLTFDVTALRMAPASPGRDLPATDKRTTEHPERANYLPLVTVSVTINGQTLDTEALLDTGTQFTILPARLLPHLGVEFDELPRGPRRQGAGYLFEVRPCRAILTFGDWRMDGIVPVTGDTIGHPILGRDDFMRHYRVTFDWHRDPPTFSVERPDA